jgi:hypothetical protein
VNLGYKLIALVAVFGATYSCSDRSNSQDGRSTAERLMALQESIGALTAEVRELRTEVASLENAAAGCSTADFLAGVCELPDDAAVTTTFCFSQGLGVDLTAKLSVGMKVDYDAGAGWPNAAWVKAGGKLEHPVVLPVPPFILPSEMAGQAGAGLGRGVDLCVDVPLEPNDEQRALLADLVTGVNTDTGIQAKYRRRANRLLNYAADRTPVAQANLNAPGATSTTTVRSAEESDDAFDIADEAVERFLANRFQPQTRATDLMADPIFRDLAASVDLPEQVASIINDPQQVFQGLRSMTSATACSTLGIDANVRARFAPIDGLCNQIASLPPDDMLKNLGSRLTTLQNAVNAIYTGSELRNFICSNVTLSLLTDCP